jgi:tetratricopeptide (TPR) repeat protein
MKRQRLRLSARFTLSIATAAALAACGLLPLVPDRQASAPDLPGYGTVEMAVTTASAQARERFAQGMAQAYAFNETEAVRMFKAALAKDPACALCAWGVAYQLGPNINAPERGDMREALRYVDHALRHMQGATGKEQALIQALALRYAHRSEARNTAMLTAPTCGGKAGDDKPDPLDVAYAERMRTLADQYPGDADIVSMYAEAEMIATKGDWWDNDTGKPAGRMGEVADRLEAALQAHPDHTGLNHYLIHATDALPAAQRAAVAADRLGRLAPNSPHLLHMPSHTYVNLGRYAEASRVNEQALAADQSLSADLGRQGFSVSKDWRQHNGSFFWYAALMEGRGDASLDVARQRAAASKGDHEFAELSRSRPMLTLVRLQRWDDVLKEPMPTGGKGMAALLGHHAQGVAQARLGQLDAAQKSLAQVDEEATKLIASHAGTSFPDKMIRSVATVSLERLRAEVALAGGHVDDAVKHQEAAVSAAKDADSSEPPMLGAGMRLALGDVQLKAQRWTDAEQTFRADLKEHPHSGWAWRGLAAALEGQGRSSDAAAAREAWTTSWKHADAAVLAMK